MKQTKKGFTLVELLVVIAILAILATVSVVGYTSFIQKAHESNDRTLVAQLNTLITRVDGQKYGTFHEVVEVLQENGIDVTKLKATATDHEILWDMDAQEFFYTADQVRNGLNIWIVSESDELHTSYSTYYIGNATSETVFTTPFGFDAGNSTVSVTCTGSDEVIIRTNGGNLTVNSGSVVHYGSGYILTVADGAQYTEKGYFATNSKDIENIGDSATGWTYVATEQELIEALDTNKAKIALSADFLVEADPSVGSDFVVKAATEINLNGHKINSVHNNPIGSANTNNGVFYVERGASLTLTGSGEITFSTNSEMGVNNCTYVIAAQGDVTIDGAIKIANLGGTYMSYAIDMRSHTPNASATLTVKSTFIYSDYCAVRLYRSGETNDDNTKTFNLVLESGIIMSNSKSPIFTQDGYEASDGIYNITINGGVLASNANKTPVVTWGFETEYVTITVNGGQILKEGQDITAQYK